MTTTATSWRELFERHFLIAVVVLGVSAAGWGAAVHWLGVVTIKQPVPWPEIVRVTEKGHRLTDPAMQMLGSYAKFARSDKNSGDTEYSEDNLKILGMATDYDNTRYEGRRSNWYFSRIYRGDNRSTHRFWTLDVYYYTGGLDLVPHIPDVCLEAGGMSVRGTDVVTFTAPGVAGEWGGPVQVCRTRFEDKDGRLLVQYYTFSLNGVPEHSRETVRLKLMNPFVRYSYFAKIQFGPWLRAGDSVTDLSETDKAAQDFFRGALPEILKTLPTERDVQGLYSQTQK